MYYTAFCRLKIKSFKRTPEITMSSEEKEPTVYKKQKNSFSRSREGLKTFRVTRPRAGESEFFIAFSCHLNRYYPLEIYLAHPQHMSAKVWSWLSPMIQQSRYLKQVK